MDPNVIDFEEVMERVQGDEELLLELFEIFEQDYQAKRDILKSAIAGQKFEQIKDLVHSVKGAAGNISAKNMHATCVQLERMAMEKNMIPLQSGVATLEKQFGDLQAAVVEIKKKLGKE